MLKALMSMIQEVSIDIIVCDLLVNLQDQKKCKVFFDIYMTTLYSSYSVLGHIQSVLAEVILKGTCSLGAIKELQTKLIL